MQSAALASATKLGGLDRGTAAPPIVDCHVHCFDGAKSAQFPFHARAPYHPEPRLPPEQLLLCMAGAGVDHGVVVHPEPYQEDHRYFEHCLAVGGNKVKGTCHFFADRPGWQQALPALAKLLGPQLAAFRVHAYAPERLPPFGAPLRALWKAGADLGLIAQIHFEPHYAPGFAPLIEEFGKTPVLIDNLGRPMFATPEEYALVLRWAKLPHVYMKLSALPSPSEYPFRDVQPIVRQLVDAFGPERLVWGGTFGAPATPESYRAGREAIRQHLAYLPATAQAAILGGTATHLFGFGQ